MDSDKISQEILSQSFQLPITVLLFPLIYPSSFASSLFETSIEYNNMSSCVDCTQRCLLFHGKGKNSKSCLSSFFKIMIDDKFSEVMFFPPKFARMVSSVIKQEIFLEDIRGNRWSTRLSYVNGSLALDQGWNTFASDHGLSFGDFLVFYYIVGSEFIVRIYDKSGCEKTDFAVCTNGRKRAKIPEKVPIPKQETSTSISFGSYEETSQGQCEMSNAEKHKLNKTETRAPIPNHSDKKRSKDAQVVSERCTFQRDFEARELEKSMLLRDKVDKNMCGSNQSNVKVEDIPTNDVIMMAENAANLANRDFPAPFGPICPDLTMKKDKGKSLAISPSFPSSQLRVVKYSENRIDPCDGAKKRCLAIAETSKSKQRDNLVLVTTKPGWSPHEPARVRGRDHEFLTYGPPTYIHSLPPPGTTFISCSTEATALPFLVLPPRFPAHACKVLRKCEKNVVFLRDPEMRLWPVLYDERCGRKRLTGGWQAFCRVNSIQAGDECCFGVENQDTGVFGVIVVRKQDK